MKKRFLTILMSMLMVFVMMPMSTWTTYAADDGIKLVNGIYEISSYEGLKEFASIVNGTHPEIEKDKRANAILTADITCKGDDWVPIGSGEAIYTGTFDGDDHIIKGIKFENNTQRLIDKYGASKESHRKVACQIAYAQHT